MSTLSQWIGVGGSALMLAHLLAWVTRPMSRSRSFNLAVLVVGMLAALIPFGEVSAAKLVWSSLGYLSIPTLALLLHRTRRLLTGRILLSRGDLFNLHAGILVFSVWFFPLAAGVGFYDPWSHGLQPLALLLVLTALGVLGLRYHLVPHVCVLLVAVLAWQFRLFQSANLWPYLCDPFLGFAALFYMLSRLGMLVFRKVTGRAESVSDLQPEPASESST